MASNTNRLAGPEAAGLRLDRWLWHARFYKSRALATAAVEAGRVKVNGARAKPSRPATARALYFFFCTWKGGAGRKGAFS